MLFYHFSPISAVLAAFVSAVALVIFWFVWTRGQHKLTPAKALISAAVAFALPWTEELWIANNFGRLCTRDAGVFLNKTVEVDGFYDDTTHWRRQLVESGYRFVESRNNLDKTLWRVERVGNDIRHHKIDRVTARYQYSQPHNHTPASYKITKIEKIVTDAQTGAVLARDTKYAREPHWFFIGLDRPVVLCPAPGRNPFEKYGLIYNIALKPKAAQ